MFVCTIWLYNKRTCYVLLVTCYFMGSFCNKWNWCDYQNSASIIIWVNCTTKYTTWFYTRTLVILWFLKWSMWESRTLALPFLVMTQQYFAHDTDNLRVAHWMNKTSLTLNFKFASVHLMMVGSKAHLNIITVIWFSLNGKKSLARSTYSPMLCSSVKTLFL